MLKIIIGLPILFIMLCVFLTILELTDANSMEIPDFILIIGKITLIIATISFVILIAYIIGGCILGG